MEGIEEILPDDVCCRTEGGERVEIGLRHPNSEGGIFLSESLAGSDGRDTCHRFRRCGGVDEDVLVVASFAGRRKVVTDKFTEAELDETGEER